MKQWPGGVAWQKSRSLVGISRLRPVAAAGRVYIVDLYGRTLVFEHGDTLRQLAYNQLDDEFAATPALVGDQLILRGRQSLYGIREVAD